MGLLNQDQVDAINQQFSGTPSAPSASTETPPQPAAESAPTETASSDSPPSQGVKEAETTPESGEVSQKVQASDKATKKKTDSGQRSRTGVLRTSSRRVISTSIRQTASVQRCLREMLKSRGCSSNSSPRLDHL